MLTHKAKKKKTHFYPYYFYKEDLNSHVKKR